MTLATQIVTDAKVGYKAEHALATILGLRDFKHTDFRRSWAENRRLSAGSRLAFRYCRSVKGH
jgi:hypothetical protein